MKARSASDRDRYVPGVYDTRLHVPMHSGVVTLCVYSHICTLICMCLKERKCLGRLVPLLIQVYTDDKRKGKKKAECSSKFISLHWRYHQGDAWSYWEALCQGWGVGEGPLRDVG